MVEKELNFEVTVYDGKYTVRVYKDGSIEALRYGEEWIDVTGNNLIAALAYELHEERR